jgi:allantoicase
VASIVEQDPDDNPNTPDESEQWADCPLTAQTVRMEIRGKHYYTVRVKTPSHDVQVYVSPQGRSVRVWLDGVPMQEEPAEVARYIERAVDGVR